MNLSFFQKPSRYIGCEHNSFKNQWKSPEQVNMALCFPDVYEVAMSHLGLKILYELINRLSYATAERVFSPWIDLEEYMKRNNILLSSLESNTPLKDFDIVGFSLQYELSYTTVLNMLNLGGIPISADERLNSKKHFPIVIAGGPCTVNPLPMSKFIDAFLIGDGEEAVLELLDLVRQWKYSEKRSRMSILKEIAKIEGFYVPFIHKSESLIKRRFIKNLDDAPYPVRPIVPYTSIVHDRINIEVSRGCTMGCRFCQAGIIYRPLRERSPETVLRIVDESLKNTGYEEVSFTSLSAGDYSYLLYVINACNRRYQKSKIAISLPSLRVAAIDRDILKEIKSVRKTGFTMAPEAATERLRNVINKDFQEEDYERALKSLFEEGWFTLKLYYMIGLPTETDYDIEAISKMAIKALNIAKKSTTRFVNINITVSPFVPKPHTPFQWVGQISLEEIRRKQKYLKEVLSSKKLNYKGHNENMSFLEAVFSRGDEKLSALIEKAWQLGCRLDGWSEHFDFHKWLDAMEKTGIDGSFYSQRTFKKDEQLPWDNIHIGVEKNFLYKEYQKALLGQKTQDCRKRCSACGLKCENAEIKNNGSLTISEEQKTEDAEEKSFIKGISELPSFRTSELLLRVRVQFSKIGALRFLSHLELVTAILRALKRAEVPFDFTKGFHPTPKVSFGPPLNVGVAGEREYFDMEVFNPFDVEFYFKKLNNILPKGIKINKIAVIPWDVPSLNDFIKKYEYIIKGLKHRSLIMDNIKTKSIIVLRNGGNIDISLCIEDLEFDGSKVRLILKDTDKVKVRLGEIVNAIFGINMAELEITRTRLYGQSVQKNEWIEPL